MRRRCLQLKPVTALFLMTLACLSLTPGGLKAHDLQDEALSKIGVDEKLGAQVPLELVFTDQTGRKVRLADYFTGGPVILTLNYYACPTLCPLIFRNLITTIHGIKGLSLGKDYRIVTVSINPEETVAAARQKAGETHAMLGEKEEPGRRWAFLMGNGPEIERLAWAVGVRYTRLEKDNFAHPSVFVVLTPAGRVARYLYGVEVAPQDLKLALIEAAKGRIGGSALLNQALLYCFHYDPVGKKYALAAMNIMKIAGTAVLLFLGVLIAALWRRERQRSGGGKG